MRTTVCLLTSDGGILDPDDYVCDVIDDREQVSTALVHCMWNTVADMKDIYQLVQLN